MGAFEYTIKTHAAARGVKISVRQSGEVVVTKSRKVSDARVRELVEGKRLWIEEVQAKMTVQPQKILADYSTVAQYKEYKEKARFFVSQKIAHWNALYNFTIGNISIRNQVTRWGSCSRKGNLNFNYKILFLPEHLADYLIVHELCHLQEMNHGQKFWDLVGQTIPTYKADRKDLQLY